MERGYAKMALDTCPVDQVARNFDARISEVRLYYYKPFTEGGNYTGGGGRLIWAVRGDLH